MLLSMRVGSEYVSQYVHSRVAQHETKALAHRILVITGHLYVLYSIRIVYSNSYCIYTVLGGTEPLQAKSRN